jgi:hypothetical protein
MMVTSSCAEQFPFVIVQRRLYEVPAVPVNVEVGLEGVVTFPPAPLVMLHAPDPIAGVLAANVMVEQVLDPV